MITCQQGRKKFRERGHMSGGVVNCLESMSCSWGVWSHAGGVVTCQGCGHMLGVWSHVRGRGHMSGEQGHMLGAWSNFWRRGHIGCIVGAKSHVGRHGRMAGG